MTTKFKQRNGPGVSLYAVDHVANKLQRIRERFARYIDGQVSAIAQRQAPMVVRWKTENILIGVTANWILDHVF